MKISYQNRNQSPLGGFVSILLFTMVLVGLYYLFSTFSYYLSRIAPILLIAALVIRYKVVITFFEQVIGLLQKMPALGILSLVLIYFMYPFVALYLFLKALRKPIPAGSRPPMNPFFFGPPKEPKNASDSEFTEFEDLTETLKEKPVDGNNRDNYDRFFD